MASDVIILAVEVSLLAAIFSLIYGLVRLLLRALAPDRVNNPSSRVAQSLQKFGIFLLLGFTLSCLGLLAINGYIIYRGDSVLETQLQLLGAVPSEFWEHLQIALLQCLGLILMVRIVLKFGVHRILQKGATLAKNLDNIQANDASIDRLFQLGDRIVSNGLWLATVSLCTQLLNLPAQAVAFSYWLLWVYLALAVGNLMVKGVPVAVDTLDYLSLSFATTNSPLRFYQRFRYLIPALKQSLKLIIYVGIASLVFNYSAPLAWLSQHANKIVGIIAVYFVVQLLVEGINISVDEFVRCNQHLPSAQRRLTIAPLLKDGFKYLAYFGALVAILNIVQVDPTPILAGAGILGIAVGFGAQNFVADLVSGFLILFENYYLVGDYIAAGRLEERPVEGIVEAIELRTTRLRHPDGQVQIVRNGEIGSVVNYSKQYIYATVDIPFAQGTHLATVYPIIEQVGQRLKQENPTTVLEETQLEGLETLGKSPILVRTITKVTPGQHLHIQRVLRRRLKDAFDEANIELTESPQNSLVANNRP